MRFPLRWKHVRRMQHELEEAGVTGVTGMGMGMGMGMIRLLPSHRASAWLGTTHPRWQTMGLLLPQGVCCVLQVVCVWVERIDRVLHLGFSPAQAGLWRVPTQMRVWEAVRVPKGMALGCAASVWTGGTDCRASAASATRR